MLHPKKFWRKYKKGFYKKGCFPLKKGHFLPKKVFPPHHLQPPPKSPR